METPAPDHGGVRSADDAFPLVHPHRRPSAGHIAQRTQHALLLLNGRTDAQAPDQTRHRAGALWAARACAAHVPRIFTARAATKAIVSSEASACTAINALAHGVSGIVSVGLNAVAFVNET